jgi:hypothetical protein
MKYSARAAALLLAAVLLAAACTPALAEEQIHRYSGWSYIIKEGEITLQHYFGEGVWLKIPSDINGYPVTCLGESALEGCAAVKTVAMPESIRRIDRWAFQGCTSLTAVTFKKGSRLETISDGVFMDCAALSGITLPKSFQTLGMFVFSGCTALKDLNVEKGNSSYVSREGVIFTADGSALAAFPPARKGEYAIPEGVMVIKGGAFGNSLLSGVQLPSTLKAIDVLAFSQCSALRTAALPEGLMELGMQAFSYCTALESVMIPASVIAIGEGAFMGCTLLTDLQVAAGSPFYTMRDGMLLTASGTELVSYSPGLKAYLEVPAGVTAVRMFAFAGCKGLLSAALPAGCLSIGVGAFMDCVNMTNITLPDSIREIRMQAFGNCPALASVILPAGLTVVERAAFMDCANLRAITVLGMETQLEGMLTPGSPVTISGFAGSTADTYAHANGFDFVTLAGSMD